MPIHPSIVYVNGNYVEAQEAKISIFDRGFLFADGVYEVSTVLDGQLVDNAAHLNRLQRSLNGLKIECPLPLAQIEIIQNELIEKNNLQEGIVYLQISRGPADRDFNFPENPKPSVVLFTQEKNLIHAPKVKTGIHVITIEDIRWKRRDLKTVGLLAQSMAKQSAADQGADDAWMVEDGLVTEGSSNNAFIVRDDGAIITRHLSNEILHGITRKAVLQLAKEENIEIIERAFSVEEAKAAKEAFITSASTFVMPLVKIDEKQINDGKPGALTLRLRDLYIRFAQNSV